MYFSNIPSEHVLTWMYACLCVYAHTHSYTVCRERSLGCGDSSSTLGKFRESSSKMICTYLCFFLSEQHGVSSWDSPSYSISKLFPTQGTKKNEENCPSLCYIEAKSHIIYSFKPVLREGVETRLLNCGDKMLDFCL